MENAKTYRLIKHQEGKNADYKAPQLFKKKRNAKEFDKGPVSGFLTMFDRENMIDRLFDILTNGLEEVDGQANQ